MPCDLSSNPTNYSAASDDDLMARMSSGEADPCLSELQGRYGRRIYHFVYGLLKDAHTAGDVAQEVFEKAYLKSHLYKAGTNFRAWLFEIARNQALSALRTQRRLPRPASSILGDDAATTDLFDSLPSGGEDRSLEEEELMREFTSAVESLPPHYRVVFDLCVRNGRPYQEAAELLGLPTGTVAIRIMRARKRLFGALSRHLDRLRRPPACFQ